MEGKAKTLEILDRKSKTSYGELTSVIDFVSTINGTMFDGLEQAVCVHRAKGDFRRWLEDIGEKEYSDALRPFEGRNIHMYAYAADLLHDYLELRKVGFSEVVGMDDIKETVLDRVVRSEKFKEASKEYKKTVGAVLS